MSEDTASLHLKVDTSDINKGQKALDDLAKTGAKTEKSIKDLGNESAKSSSSVDRLGQAALSARGAFTAFAGVIATLQLASLVRDSAMLASRFETMGIVMRVAGNNAGYTASEMERYSKALQTSGISMMQSRNALVQLATANIDLTKAQTLGRVAQDLAVLANVNSSEAMQRMIHGIKSGEVEVLKTLGLNVSFEASYKSLARQLGIKTDALTENQKVMARTNIVIAESAKFVDIYEESMTTAGKAITSLARYWENLKIKMGDVFLPTLADMVFKLTDALKAANDQLDKMGASGLISSIGNGLHKAFKTMFEVVAIGGANVAFVFAGIGREIGGLAAQAAALFGGGGGLKMVSQIRKDMIAENEAAVKALDAFTASILSNGAATSTTAKISEAERIAAGKASREKAEADEKAAKAADEAAKAAKKHAEAYGNLIEGITRKIAAAKLEASLGRELTEGEKLYSDAMANSTSGVLRLSEKEKARYGILTKELDILNKVSEATEKLKKARKEIDEIVTKSKADNDEHIAKLEFENSIIGKSVLQQQLLRSEYEANLTLKRQFADIDKATKGMTDPAAISKLKAESDARIQAIKDEAKARIEAKYLADVNSVIQARKDPEMAQLAGERLMPEETARRTALAQVEHAAALSKIADLDVIRGRIEIEAKLKEKIATAESEAQDIELVRATGASIMADEAAEKIAKYGADNVAFEAAALAISRDRGLIEQRGMVERNQQLAERVIFFTAEAETAKEKLGMSANQLAFDNANLTLQQQLSEIQRDAVDKDEQLKLGLATRIGMQGELIEFLAKKKNLDLSQVGSGEELVRINKELLNLSQKMNGLDIAAADKAKIKADSAARQLEEAKILADTVEKTMWSNMITSMESDFHNGMLRLLEQGKTTWSAMVKGFANSFKVGVVDYMYKQLAKPFVFKIIASLAGLVGANGMALAANTAAEAAASGSGANVAGSLLSNAFSSYLLKGTSLSSIGTSIGAGFMSTLGGGSIAAGSAAGVAATSIPMAGASGTVASGGAAGSSTLGAIGAAAPYVIAAVVIAAAFGLFAKTKKVGGGITGTLGDDSDLSNYEMFRRGGSLLRGPKYSTTHTNMDDAQENALKTAFINIKGASIDAAKSLGLATEGMVAFTKAFSIEAPTAEKIAAMFDGIADDLAAMALGDTTFSKAGERASATLMRLSVSLAVVNETFTNFGVTLFEVGLAGADAASKLIDAMGGPEAFLAKTTAYYNDFYSDEEKRLNTIRQINENTAGSGLDAATATRDQFRKIAEGLNLTTEAGRAMYAKLMNVAPAFASITQATEDLAAALQEVIALQGRRDTLEIRYNTLQGNSARALMLTRQIERAATDESNRALLDLVYAQEDYNASLDRAKKAVTEAFAGIQRAVARERDVVTKAYQASLDKVAASVTTVTASIDKLKTLSNALKQAVAGIMPPSRAEAQAQILTALTIARAGGGLPTAESLSGALQSISEPSERLFSTFVEWQTDQKITANNIAALAGMSDEQITVQDKQLGVLEATRKILEGTQAETMARLDGILARGQSQLDGMNAVETSVFSVATAVDGMTDAVNAFLRVLNKEPGFVGNESQGTGTGTGGTYSFEDQARDRYGAGSIAGAGRAGATSAGSVGGGSAAFNKAWSALNHVPYDSRSSQGPLEEYYRLLTASKPAQYHIPPGFAMGTDFVPQDMTARIHEGEAIIPKAFNRNNASTNAELVAEIKDLKKELKDAIVHLNIDTNINAIKTKKTADILEKWETTGVAPERATL